MTRVPVALLVVAALAAGCQKKAESEAAPGKPGAPAAPPQSAEELKTPLAKIDDVTITLAEFQDRINRQSPYIRARYTSLEQKKEFLDSLVRFEVLAKEAYRRGFDKDPEVVRTMKQVMIQKLMREELDQKITADSVPEADLKDYYDKHRKEYERPEEVRVTAVIVKNRAQADRVAQEARGDAGKTNKGFRDLVLKYSADEDSKLRGGDLRFFDAATKDVPAPVVKAAFALANTGDVSDAVDARNGSFYVLKQTGRRLAMTTSFDDAKPQIRNKLFREKRMAAQKDFVDRARAKAKIEINEANLAKVRIDTSNAPGGDDGQPRENVVPPLPGTGSGAPGAPGIPGAEAPGAGSPPPAPKAPAAGSTAPKAAPAPAQPPVPAQAPAPTPAPSPATRPSNP